MLCVLYLCLTGGAGGGIIHLKTTKLHNDGTISANGASVTNSNGGGAGGSILIELHELDGMGRFQVCVACILRKYSAKVSLDICFLVVESIEYILKKPLTTSHYHI